MLVQINGKKQELVKELSIADLLDKLSLSPTTVVIELNQIILNADNYSNIHLKDGDKVELIRFVGGG